VSDTVYLRTEAKFPYCKGCGHGLVLRALEKALASADLEPRDVCIVTDIGCVGLADELFEGPHTVHTTHGRSAAFASGISLANAVLGNGRMKTIVLMGDGGATIGISHLIHGAALNPDVTVIVHDNFLFGMTGGQHSAFSPMGFVTATTRDGNFVPPLNLAGLLSAAGAPFVARKLATDRDLSDCIAGAIAVPGFSVVEVLELCTAYGVRWNAVTGKALREIALGHGWEFGVLRRSERPSFSEAWRMKHPSVAQVSSSMSPDADPVEPIPPPQLDREVGIVVAGSAGEHAQSAAGFLARAAIRSGLRATQKNDNPVTQGAGFSLSEVLLSPRSIGFTAIERPFAILVASADGARELSRGGHLERCLPETVLIVDDSVDFPAVPGAKRFLPLRRLAGASNAALAAVFALVEQSGILPVSALEFELRQRHPDRADDILSTVRSAFRT
jgi:pyruvate/2-oxoacid:ferredoxin oxidoreductase beta subunit